jgi:hypothetical protein
MISWQSVLFHSAWILGLSILLATFSYHFWLAGQAGNKVIAQLGDTGFLRFFWLGIGLICVGLAGTSGRLWEIVLWAVLALVAFVGFVRLLR